MVKILLIAVPQKVLKTRLVSYFYKILTEDWQFFNVLFKFHISYRSIRLKITWLLLVL